MSRQWLVSEQLHLRLEAWLQLYGQQLGSFEQVWLLLLPTSCTCTPGTACVLLAVVAALGTSIACFESIGRLDKVKERDCIKPLCQGTQHPIERCSIPAVHQMETKLIEQGVTHCTVNRAAR